ncbi:uncharacterized protein J4E78_002453 [Alternaria triticimaculans]|uniref:uncharacterized protein n=1 Tax=Alternaria triticimaculans TaxID=297637 RepID=UPI0020C48CCC|nr:uncharacterized protein J4E78_002453 [Alternaria triticimaculans]KAI4668626.1 hypothetical protein J4E78_002453 [Alternaria triticimaculans]
MPLLDLPMEVFEEVIAALAKKVGQRNVVRYRFICKTFASTIKDHIITVIASENLAQSLDLPSSARLFDTYGSEILCKATLRRQTTGNQVTDFVRKIVKVSQPDPSLYPEQVDIVCTSMMALEPKYLRGYIKGTETINKEGRPCTRADMWPAIAAASGDIALFKMPKLTPFLLLKQSHDLLPSALKAAIAANQHAMLAKILKYLVDNVKGKSESASWKDKRNATEKISKALCTAIRLHKNVAGNMLLDFRDENNFFNTYAPIELGDWLVTDAFKYDNATLLYRVLEVNKPGIVARVKKGTQKHYNLGFQSIETLYRRGGIKTWSMLLEDGIAEPNKVFLDKTPLQHALKRRRYDLAHILIEKGASIDSITKEGNNILWQAVNDGYAKDVKFLLSHGADLRVVGRNGHSAISIATLHGYGKCRFLLEKVRDHGKEYLERTDLWAVYETEVFDDRWGF